MSLKKEKLQGNEEKLWAVRDKTERFYPEPHMETRGPALAHFLRKCEPSSAQPTKVRISYLSYSEAAAHL